MATYLVSLPPAGALGSGGTPGKSKAYVAGAKLFVENCAPCHGSDGAGQPDLAPPLAGNPMAIAPSPNNLISIVLGGQVAQHGSMEMPNFKATATDAEIADMATFVRGAGQRRLARESRGGRGCPQGRGRQVAPASPPGRRLAPFQRPHAFAGRGRRFVQALAILDRVVRFADLLETDADDPASWRSDARS